MLNKHLHVNVGHVYQQNFTELKLELASSPLSYQNEKAA